tara:strand:- start:283 stop:1119 length:837 start_codon:yes stop_codon:yes gene_type:complete
VVLPQIIGGGLGAIQGGMQGGLKGALLGGALGAAIPGVGGALGTRLAGTKLGVALGKGVAGGLTKGSGGLWGAASGLGREGVEGLGRTAAAQSAQLMNAGARQALGPTGLGGLGAATYLGLGSPGLGAVAGMGSRAIDRAVGGGSGIIGYNSVTGEPITAAGAAVPPGLGQYGGTNMYGSNPYDVIDPSGAMSANRLMQLKQAETNARMLDTIAGTQMKWTEETKRRDLERQLAAAGIRQNILTQANMLQAANTAGLTQGTNAMQQVGGALTNNYSYS